MSETVLINILSDQVMPNFIATMEVAPSCVVALASKDSQKQAKVLEDLTGVPHEIEPFKPYDFQEDFHTILRLIKGIPEDDEIIINFTGGTKVMSVTSVMGAIAAGADRTFEMVYVDTSENYLQRIRVEKGRLIALEPKPLTKLIPFEACIILNNEKIRSSNSCLSAAQEERLSAARLLSGWQMNNFFNNQKKRFFDNGKLKLNGEFKFSAKDPKGITSYGRCSWSNHKIEITPPKKDTVLLEGDDILEYITGGWLEEYIFALCRDSGKFDDLLCNVVLSLKDDTIQIIKQKYGKKHKTDKNELDVVVTKGVRSAIIECKSGNIFQEHIYKVAALRDALLGRHGVAVIAARFPPAPGIKEKAKDFNVEIITKLKSVPNRVSKLLGGDRISADI